MAAGLSIAGITTVPAELTPSASFSVKVRVQNSTGTEATGVILVASYNGIAIGPAASGGGVYVGTEGETAGDGKIPANGGRDTVLQIAGQPQGAGRFCCHLAGDLGNERCLDIYIGTKPVWWYWVKEHPEYTVIAIGAVVAAVVLVGKFRRGPRGPVPGQVIPYEQKIPIPYPVAPPAGMAPRGLEQMRFGPIISGDSITINEEE